MLFSTSAANDVTFFVSRVSLMRCRLPTSGHPSTHRRGQPARVEVDLSALRPHRQLRCGRDRFPVQGCPRLRGKPDHHGRAWPAAGYFPSSEVIAFSSHELVEQEESLIALGHQQVRRLLAGLAVGLWRPYALAAGDRPGDFAAQARRPKLYEAEVGLLYHRGAVETDGRPRPRGSYVPHRGCRLCGCSPR